MEFIRKYWPMLVMLVGLISSTTAAQIQVEQNKQDIAENSKSAFASDAKIILLIQNENREIKKTAEAKYSEAKREFDKLKTEQQKQTEIRINQKYIQEDLKEIKSSFKELLIEIRSIKR